MTPHLTLLVAVRAPDGTLERVAAMLSAQTLDGVEAIVIPAGTGGGRLARALHPSEGVLLAAPSASWGDALAGGLAAARAPLVAIVDGSEELEPTYFAEAVAALDGNPAADLAAAELIPGAFPPGVAVGADLPRLVASAWALPVATVVRRSALASVGPDPGAASLFTWDLWLSLAERGHRGVVLPRPLVGRRAGNPALWATLRPDVYLPSFRRVVERHRETFARYAADALCGREPTLRALWAEERDRVAHRERFLKEADALARDVCAARDRLTALGRPRPADHLTGPEPLSRYWGIDRGTPIDRHYIHAFLAAHAADIRGRVLEVLNPDMTRRFGGGKVSRVDVLDNDATNAAATIVADLRDAPEIPSDAFDCIILTQTLHVIDAMDEALATAYRALRPGGVLLATLPCLSMTAREYGVSGDCWRVTAAGARHLGERVFPAAGLEVTARGNLRAATAFLHGLACEEVPVAELDADDPAYPVLVTVRARKPLAGAARARSGSAILLYHRVAEAPPPALAVPPATFHAQLDLLARTFDCLPFEELARRVAAGDVPERAVALTFDDGYADNLEHALPALEARRIPATFFLTTEGTGGEHEIEMWWDALARILLGPEPLPDQLELGLAGLPERIPLQGAEARRAAYDRLHDSILPLGPARRDHTIRLLARACGRPRVGPRAPLLSRTQVEALARSPVATIGAHGVHHLALTTQPTRVRFLEIVEARSALERLTGRPLASFAYPFGFHDDATVGAVRGAGFRFAVTTVPEALHGAADPLRLPRLAVEAWDADKLGQVLRDALSPR